MADEPSLSPPKEEITLFEGKNNEVLVWSAEDVHKLRTKYRIVGSLTGSLPRKPKQNVYLSLPLLLSNNETTLLLEKRIARLVKNEVRPPLPSQNEVEAFKIAREESTSGQIKLFLEENKEREREFANCIKEGRGKKKTRERKRQRGKDDVNLKPSKVAKIEHEREDSIDNKDVLSEKLDKSLNSVDHESLIKDTQGRTAEKQLDIFTIETKELTNVIMDDKSIDKDPLEDIDDLQTSGENQQNNIWQEKPSGSMEEACLIHIPTRISKNKTKDFLTQEWNYPQTEIEKLQYKVFLDLWEKGFYITTGSKFGGDFLAYPGDPIKFHSFYVIIVVPWTKKIGMLELISLGRLAAIVKKTAVLGSVTDKGEIVYTSLKWTGFS